MSGGGRKMDPPESVLVWEDRLDDVEWIDRRYTY